MTRTTVLVTEVHPGEGEEVAQVLVQSGEIEVIAYAQDALEAAQAAYRLRPDAAVLWADLPGMSALELCDLIVRTAPEVAPVVLTRANAPDLTVEAMMAGARAVVRESDIARLPAILAELQQVRQQLPRESIQAVTDTAKAPVLVAVVGTKGGIGKTTIAVNLAVLLARKHGEKVALVDIPGQLSDAHVFLDLTPRHSFGSLAEVSAFDADFVARIMSVHESGVHYLAATGDSAGEQMARSSEVTVELASQVLAALKRRFTAVVLDCPLSYWPLASYVLRRTHVVIAVATLEDMAALRSALSLRELLLSAGLDDERVVPLVNKVRRGSPLTVEDFERVTGWASPVSVPEDEKNCAAALNEGVPLVLRTPGSPAAEVLARLSLHVLQKARLAAGMSTGKPQVTA
ncbi:MAG: AAA family ATPase [Armatimonadetes bacterium]|nr:AAA family ATPase [Armatimonadota bacterium]